MVVCNCIGSLSPSLSLSRSLGGHVWNHLVSQKTGQNHEEDTCNVRSAKRGERRGEGREKIENNVQACYLKSSAQKVRRHRPRDFSFEAQDSPWELQGLCWDILGLLGRSLELLRNSLGALVGGGRQYAWQGRIQYCVLYMV